MKQEKKKKIIRKKKQKKKIKEIDEEEIIRFIMERPKFDLIKKYSFKVDRLKYDQEEEAKKVKIASKLVKNIHHQKELRKKKILERQRKKLDDLMDKVKCNKVKTYLETLKKSKKLDIKKNLKNIKKRKNQRILNNKVSNEIITQMIKSKFKIQNEETMIRTIQQKFEDQNLLGDRKKTFSQNYGLDYLKNHKKKYLKTIKALTEELKNSRNKADKQLKTKKYKISKIGKLAECSGNLSKEIKSYNNELKKQFELKRKSYSKKVRFLNRNSINPDEVVYDETFKEDEVNINCRNTFKIKNLSKNTKKILNEALDLTNRSRTQENTHRSDLNEFNFLKNKSNYHFTQNIYEMHNMRNSLKINHNGRKSHDTSNLQKRENRMSFKENKNKTAADNKMVPEEDLSSLILKVRNTQPVSAMNPWSLK